VRTFGDAEDDNDTAEELVRYIYSNHLQSASLELDDNAAIISYEEYHPYGTTSYQAMNASIKAVAKRYRYTGKERDDESGLYYHGARYYVPWLGRWSASDPLESKYAGLSPYNYSFNNPVVWNDLSGMGPGDDSISDAPVEKNYYPNRSFSDMKVVEEYPYKWQEDGQWVTTYYDDKSDRNYSILESKLPSGEIMYSSFVDKQTGIAEALESGRPTKGLSNYKWVPFESLDQKNARLMKSSVGELSKNVAIGLGISLALPYAAGAGIASGIFSLNTLGWGAVVNASADLTHK
jgi:RHS repeat-associated protein